MTITFGTEGWRAIIAEEFTFEHVRMVAQAIAEHMRSTSRAATTQPFTLAVGHDTRFLSDRFAQAVSEVLAGNGLRVVLTDRAIPTPALSRYVVAHRLAAGVMVTASHNPSAYNGIKVKEAFGGSAISETVASIERRIGQRAPKRLDFAQAIKQGLVRRANMLPDFLKGIASYVNLRVIRQSRFKVLLDPMHGAADSLMEQLLSGDRLKVETLHATPDPLFGGHAPEPIGSHLRELSQELKRRRWDIGLATDGDADRIGIIAPNGAFLNPGQIMCMILEHLMTSRNWSGAVVKTVSNTSMIDRLAASLGLKLIEVPVGFKHVAKLMLESDVLIGGEESGGIGVKGYLPERDGMLMGLLVLEAMATQRTGVLGLLRGLERRFGTWTYARRDLTVSFEQVGRFFDRLRRSPPSRMGVVPVARVNTLDGVKLIGKDESWLLFRRSGTEPIVRVYAESLSARRVTQLLNFGVGLITRA